MSELMELERMGYRFRMEGDAVTYRLLGEPPPGAEALLRRLDREQVRAVLRDRARGYTVVKPREVVVPWEDRYPYMHAIKAALDDRHILNDHISYLK